MASSGFLGLSLIHIALLLSFCFAEDPFVHFDFEVSYITASPLGVPQQVCSSDLSVFYFLPLVSLDLLTRVWFIFMNGSWVGLRF